MENITTREPIFALNSTQDARMLLKEISVVRDVVLSTQTVRNPLREVGMRPRVSAKAPLLTRAHKVAHLNFTLNHQY